MNNDEIIDLGDLERRSVKLKIGNEFYTLKEPDAASAARFSRRTTKNIKKVGETVSIESMEGVDEASIQLLCDNLFDESGKTVTTEKVYGWPARIRTKLQAELNKLRKDEGTLPLD